MITKHSSPGQENLESNLQGCPRMRDAQQAIFDDRATRGERGEWRQSSAPAETAEVLLQGRLVGLDPRQHGLVVLPVRAERLVQKKRKKTVIKKKTLATISGVSEKAKAMTSIRVRTRGGRRARRDGVNIVLLFAACYDCHAAFRCAIRRRTPTLNP